MGQQSGDSTVIWEGFIVRTQNIGEVDRFPIVLARHENMNGPM